jgi:hypothetical protein
MSSTTQGKIGDKIDFKGNRQSLEVHISGKIPRIQESLFMAWMAAWTFCGIYFMYELAIAEDSGLKTFLFISLTFWSFFFIRFGKTLLWRIKGKESLRIADNTFEICFDYGLYKRRFRYVLVNIQRFGMIPKNELNFMNVLDNAFWSLGGERIGFDYMGKRVRFAKQLGDKEVTALIRLLEKHMR